MAVETPQLQVTSFSQPVTRNEVRAYRLAYKPARYIRYVVSGTLVLAAYMMFLDGLAGRGLRLGTPVWVLSLGAVIGFSIRWYENMTITKNIRFQRFSESNGFQFHPKVEPQETGAIFDIGHSKHADAVVSGTYQGKPFWFGTYFYTVGSGKHSQTIATGVLNITLPRAVPYVCLMAIRTECTWPQI